MNRCTAFLLMALALWSTQAASSTGSATVGDACAFAEHSLHAALAPYVERLEVVADRGPQCEVGDDTSGRSFIVRPGGLVPTWRRRTSLWIDVMDGGQYQKSVLVHLRLAAWHPGWVADRDLAAGTVLDGRWLHEELVDVTVAGKLPWQGALAGRVLRGPAMSGQYLLSDQVIAAPAVMRGQRIEAHHRWGGVEVLAAAQALQDGDVGQHIQVRIDGALGPVLARVTGSERVELLR